MVVKSQVRIMSCACGLRSIGKTRPNRSGSSIHPPAICGDNDDVRPGVHDVSVTDKTARPASLRLVPPGRAVGRGVDRQPFGLCGEQLLGERLAGVVEPVPDRERHPEERWREMFQSPVSPSTQDSKRARMNSGVPAELPPRCSRRSRMAIVRTYHWGEETISRGRSPRS